jgi:RimJ/RimL family protein N-acetyltransferase
MMKLRKAEASDWARLFAWRNDDGTVAGSISQLPVPMKDHMEWMARTLKDKTKLVFVGYDDSFGATVGKVQLDLAKDKKRAVVSITVSPELRGRGYAKLMLDQVEAHAREAGVARLCATVRTENGPSLRAFAALGYLPVKHRDDEGFVELEKAL